jgi:hypothetical protein
MRMVLSRKKSIPSYDFDAQPDGRQGLKSPDTTIILPKLYTNYPLAGLIVSANDVVDILTYSAHRKTEKVKGMITGGQRMSMGRR